MKDSDSVVQGVVTLWKKVYAPELSIKGSANLFTLIQMVETRAYNIGKEEGTAKESLGQINIEEARKLIKEGKPLGPGQVVSVPVGTNIQTLCIRCFQDPCVCDEVGFGPKIVCKHCRANPCICDNSTFNPG